MMVCRCLLSEFGFIPAGGFRADDERAFIPALGVVEEAEFGEARLMAC
jgi:hypothetical protein